jgi:hypothetical protein
VSRLRRHGDALVSRDPLVVQLALAAKRHRARGVYLVVADPIARRLDAWTDRARVLPGAEGLDRPAASGAAMRSAGSLVSWLEVPADESSQRGFELRREGQKQGEIVG